MQKISLDALVREHLEKAAGDSAGRSSATVHGGHERVLRQTLVTMMAGRELAEHANPGEATLLVLRGRVRLDAGEDSWEGRQGDFIIVPEGRHSLIALEDSAVLLSAARHA